MSGSEAEKDYYAILGAEADAGPEEIERLYKRLALRHHPDRRGGCEEEMKAINEAHAVLGDVAARRAYDAARQKRRAAGDEHPRASRSAQMDAIGGRLVSAVWCLIVGLMLLLLVRFQYIRFLWPLAVLAVFVVIAGVAMAHAAMVFARERFAPMHPARRFAWAQEIVFWSCVGGGAYGVYLIMSVI